VPGQDLFESLVNYAKEQNLQASYIATCVGSLTKCNIRFANKPAGTAISQHHLSTHEFEF
jgi:hypothetical protein